MGDSGPTRTKGPRAISTLLYVLAGWVVLSVLAYLLILPSLTVGARSDRLRQRLPSGLAAASPAGVPSPQRLGYSGVVLERLAHHARSVLACEQAWILVTPPDARAWSTAVAGAGTEPDLIGRRFSPAHGVADLGAIGSATVSAGSARCTVCVAGPGEHRRLEPRECELLGEVATLTGEALRHHDRRELTLGDSKAEIRALVGALAETDGATYRHSLEVAATAKVVAQRLGLDRADLVEVELGALLHDVGKLRLPPSMLHQTGPLTEDELELVRLHPEWGAEMVAGIPGLEAVALIVRLHHERPDGEGYPHGLTGERIPMASRVVSACAAYGAMTQRPTYGERLDTEAAVEELAAHAGTQFDPEVVEVLASFVRQSVALAA